MVNDRNERLVRDNYYTILLYTRTRARDFVNFSVIRFRVTRYKCISLGTATILQHI